MSPCHQVYTKKKSKQPTITGLRFSCAGQHTGLRHNMSKLFGLTSTRSGSAREDDDGSNRFSYKSPQTPIDMGSNRLTSTTTMSSEDDDDNEYGSNGGYGTEQVSSRVKKPPPPQPPVIATTTAMMTEEEQAITKHFINIRNNSRQRQSYNPATFTSKIDPFPPTPNPTMKPKRNLDTSISSSSSNQPMVIPMAIPMVTMVVHQMVVAMQQWIHPTTPR